MAGCKSQPAAFPVLTDFKVRCAPLLAANNFRRALKLPWASDSFLAGQTSRLRLPATLEYHLVWPGGGAGWYRKGRMDNRPAPSNT